MKSVTNYLCALENLFRLEHRFIVHTHNLEFRMFASLRACRLGIARPCLGMVIPSSSLHTISRSLCRKAIVQGKYGEFSGMVSSTRAYAQQTPSVLLRNAVRFASTASKAEFQKAGPKTGVLGSSAIGLNPKEKALAMKLDWEEFLTLRKKQRRISIVSSVVGTLIAMGIAWVWVATKEIDPTETIFGLDAFTVYIGGIMCVGGVGYLLGPPLIGDTIFNLPHRGVMGSYRIKQKMFLKHVRKMRVDASRQSMNNPVPDYYGEKIGSLKDYRQWLRDCNEYRRKAKEFL